MFRKYGKKLLVGLFILLGFLLIAHFSSKAQIGGEWSGEQDWAIWGDIFPHSGDCAKGFVDAYRQYGPNWFVWVATTEIDPKFDVYSKYIFAPEQLGNIAAVYRIIPRPEDPNTDPEPNYADVYWEPSMSVRQDWDFYCVGY